MVKVACAVCGKHEADKGVKLFMCSRCESVPYCSKECQRSDWKSKHKKVCKSLNIGDAQQIFQDSHASRSDENGEFVSEIINGRLGDSYTPDFKALWDLFFQSKDKASHSSTLKKMRRLFKRQTKQSQQNFFFQSINGLSRAPTDMLDLPTSPLKIALEYVDPNVYTSSSENSDINLTGLHYLARLADPRDDAINNNQCIIGKQLLKVHANVNARGNMGAQKQLTPLHLACHTSVATNLEFIRLLVEYGADPNARNTLGETPLHYTMPYSCGAAKFLLEECELTDPNITVSSREAAFYGKSFLAVVRENIEKVRTGVHIVVAEDERPQYEFLLEQFLELEEILVQRGALEIGREHLLSI